MSQRPQFARHLQFQSGCYLDKTEFNSTVTYARSSRITDIGWNYIYASDPELAIEAAITDSRELKTVFFSTRSERDRLLQVFPAGIVHKEAWLERDTPLDNTYQKQNPFSHVDISDKPIPSNDFLGVFCSVLSDLGASTLEITSFEAQYATSLRSAQLKPGQNVRHLVAFVDGDAVACASIYFDSTFACLYNVGAATTFTKKGYGSFISGLAVNLAFSQGVSRIFLQCSPGGYVEAMYRKLGFASISDEAGFIAFA